MEVKRSVAHWHNGGTLYSLLFKGFDLMPQKILITATTSRSWAKLCLSQVVWYPSLAFL